MVDAADLAFSTVDDGSEYFNVDATFGDSQSTPSDGISAANNLANAGVPAVVGGASTNVHISASEQVFIPNGMCACSPSATAVTISQIEDDGLLYRTTPSDALQGQVMAQYATEELGAGTAAVLHVNDDYGSALSGSFVSAFEERDGTVQQEVSYETSASSYTSRIESAVQDDPDMLAVVGYAESGIQLFRDYYAQYSADRDIMTVDGLNTARVPNEVGQSMDNVVGTAPLVEGPGQETFNQMYEEAFDTAPGPFNPQTFDAAAVLMLANAAAGENDGQAIAEQMRAVANEGEMTVTPDNLAEGVDAAAEGEDVVYEGASSQVSFDDNGDLETGAYEVWAYAPDTERGIETIAEFTV
jgi:ABC-type branched-subunit amino acid transport system substrate-binding protein